MIIYFQKKIKYQGQTSSNLQCRRCCWVGQIGQAKLSYQELHQSPEGRKKPNPVTENLAPSEISRDKANHSRRKHSKGNSTNVTPAQVHSVAFHSRKTLDPGRRWPSRCVLLSPLDKCASQAASDKVKNELIHGLHFVWVNTRLPLNPVDMYRSQWAEKEFHFEFLPWGMGEFDKNLHIHEA